MYFFAICGLSGNTATNFDPAKIVHSCLVKYASFDEALAQMKKELEQVLMRELRIQKDSGLLKRTLLDTDVPMSVGIIYFQSGKPHGIVFEFKVANIDTLELEYKEDSCPGNCPEGIKVLYFGKTNAIKDRVKKGGTPAEIADELINIQIQATPDFVGAPVDLVELDRNGVTWHRRKEDCPIVLK